MHALIARDLSICSFDCILFNITSANITLKCSHHYRWRPAKSRPCSLIILIAFKQGGIIIVPHLLGLRYSGFAVLFEEPPNVIVLYDNQGVSTSYSYSNLLPHIGISFSSFISQFYDGKNRIFRWTKHWIRFRIYKTKKSNGTKVLNENIGMRIQWERWFPLFLMLVPGENEQTMIVSKYWIDWH